jgi:hypothetical protein
MGDRQSKAERHESASVRRCSWRSQLNAMETMTFVAAFYTVSWAPNYLLAYSSLQVTINSQFMWSVRYAI